MSSHIFIHLRCIYKELHNEHYYINTTLKQNCIPLDSSVCTLLTICTHVGRKDCILCQQNLLSMYLESYNPCNSDLALLLSQPSDLTATTWKPIGEMRPGLYVPLWLYNLGQITQAPRSLSFVRLQTKSIMHIKARYAPSNTIHMQTIIISKDKWKRPA